MKNLLLERLSWVEEETHEISKLVLKDGTTFGGCELIELDTQYVVINEDGARDICISLEFIAYLDYIRKDYT